MVQAVERQSQSSMSKLVYILAGGALGASMRYGISLLVFRVACGSFPWGTLIVNVLGSFLAGFAWAYLNQSSGPERINALFIIGMMGAFTTFSAYALESLRLFESGSINLALGNVLANNSGALLAAFAGFTLARWLFPQVV
jgi:fluoride exporter